MLDWFKNEKMRRMPPQAGDNQSMADQAAPALYASGDAAIIADGLHAIAEAIKDHTKALSLIDNIEAEQPAPNVDMSGRPIRTR